MSTKSAANSEDCFAHSRPDAGYEDWEPLARHAADVGNLAAEFAQSFGWAGVGRAAGLLHDAGKASSVFQDYIRGKGQSADHSTFGARVAQGLYKERIGRILALCIAGHHAGLSDAETLDRRLNLTTQIPDASGWTKHIDAPAFADLKPTRTFRAPRDDDEARAFTRAFLVRMLFSCLVDADFLATEAFISRGGIERGIDVGLDLLQARLDDHLRKLREKAAPTELNSLRTEILQHAAGKAAETPGFFTLTVPTGGGKTLTSLSFALAHALAHSERGMRRVIYVIPFTSIIEQTAATFRKALGDDVVLEHHSNFDWEFAAKDRDGGDNRDGLGVLRRAAENWDAPIVVTTAVQFFESLFANRTSACRKLHNIAGSVIVLDEAQTLPQPFLLPCLAVLDELRQNYGVSVVFCTATQPALRLQDGALSSKSGQPLGLDIPEDRELAPRPAELYKRLRRTEVEMMGTPESPVSDDVIAERFAARPQMMCIVNSRGHARALFDRIAEMEGAAHLTTLMCPAHRREVLADLRERLKYGKPVRLVATSLIEAGVDISFPEVWRAMAGVDSIAQAAGRCNREGELLPELGRVVVFTPADGRTPPVFKVFQQAARGVLRDYEDKLSLEAVGAYFRQLWFQKGTEALDCARIADQLGHGVLAALHQTAQGDRFPYESIARAFRLIDDITQPVVVPWNEEAKKALAVVAAAERAPREALRKLQQFTVGVPKNAYHEWRTRGAIISVRPEFGDTLMRFVDTGHYRSKTGVDLAEAAWRNAEDNQF